MKRNYFLICMVIFFSAKLNAQEISYDTSSIPANVKNNVPVVVRSENIEFEVPDIDHAKLSVHKVITILNDKGKDRLYFREITDKFTSLDDFEVRMYDMNGKSIGKYKQKDLRSMSIAEGFMDDDKRYLLQVSVPFYPVTIEYNYKIKFKGTLLYPHYEVLEPNEGVEFSSFTVKIAKELDLRYKEKNIQIKPVIKEDGNYKVYNWQVKNLSPIVYEEGAVSYESRYPSILLAPNHFKLDDYEGDMTSWKSFGIWYGNLSKGMDILSDEKKVFYNDLVKNATNDREKVKIIYNYLQKNFRYVSIQLGIGGFKPFPADFTDSKKYGDCKGLSNYMQAVLHVIGIKSYQALINARYNKEPVDPEFPCDQFNHVIVCVPLQKDSIWLECTSRTTDFGTLGSFTENRNALLITENGGVLVATPKSVSSNNTIKIRTMVDLKEDGSGKTNTTFTAIGEYKQDMINLMDEKADEQKSSIMDRWGFKDPSEIKFVDDQYPNDFKLTVEQELETIPELKTGSKMFLNPSICNIWTFKLPKAENRQLDYYFTCPFEKTDTTIFKLPGGYKADALPESKSNSCKYASYSIKYWYEETTGKIFSATKIVLTQYKIPAKEYVGVKKFFDDILIDRQQRIVIKK
ncbi:MAG: DUF3857 domain-containing protein [Bacteroidetes bacterium]|nr:DUF3857 domain-containing protein [Bacteroidota bacterium]